MKIEVKSTATTEKSGTSKTGRAYTIREQEAWVSLNGEYRRLRFALKDGANAYPVGEYTLGEGSFVINQFGGLEVVRLELAPLAVRKVG